VIVLELGEYKTALSVTMNEAETLARVCRTISNSGTVFLCVSLALKLLYGLLVSSIVFDIFGFKIFLVSGMCDLCLE